MNLLQKSDLLRILFTSFAVERVRVLSADEIRTMWEALTAADMRESTRNIIRLCLVTGQRVGEGCGMTRNEIDLDIGVWVIPAARSKNKREHVVLNRPGFAGCSNS